MALFPNLAYPQYRRAAHWRSLATRPDTCLRLVCALVVVWAASQVLLFGFGRDQSIYAVVGQGVAAGQMPYRDLWDFKPPGIFLVYAAADALFGSKMWGPRVFEAIGLIASAGLLVRLSRLFFADTRPGYISAALASLLYVQFEYWHTGQPRELWRLLHAMRSRSSPKTTPTRRRTAVDRGHGFAAACVSGLRS